MGDQERNSSYRPDLKMVPLSRNSLGQQPDRPARIIPQSTFPYHNPAKTQLLQFIRHFGVPRTILDDLASPEILPGTGIPEVSTMRMPVPEAALHLYHGFPLWQDDIGTTR